MQRDIFGIKDDGAVIPKDDFNNILNSGIVNIKAEPASPTKNISLGNNLDSYPIKRKFEELEELGSEGKEGFSVNGEEYKFASAQNEKIAYKDGTDNGAWSLPDLGSFANINTSTSDITNSYFMSSNNHCNGFVPQFATQFGIDLNKWDYDFKISDGEINEERKSILKKEEREKAIAQIGYQQIEKEANNKLPDYSSGQKTNASCLRPTLPRLQQLSNSESHSFLGPLPSFSHIAGMTSNILPKLQYEPLQYDESFQYGSFLPQNSPAMEVDSDHSYIDLDDFFNRLAEPAASILSSLPVTSSPTLLPLENLKVEPPDNIILALQKSSSNNISGMNVNTTNEYGEVNEPWTPLEKPLNPTQTEQELRNLLASIPPDEPPPPEVRKGTPNGLKPNLMEHQKVGVGWMIEHEDKSTRGGILADDMGLGKTIQSLALILSNRSTDKQCKTTLVVTSVALAHQWAKELETKTEKNVLSVCVYHGPKRNKNPERIMNYDVVITTYQTVSQEYNMDVDKEVKNAEHGCLFKCAFYRVILDEAQTIKNKATRSARACCAIDAAYRWCLSATPIQNNVTELFSLIKFLRIKPYCEWERFKNDIEKPMKNGRHKRAMKKVQVLLKAIMLRRTKKCKLDGQPILQLPERIVNIVHTPFGQEQQEFYSQIEAKTRVKFNKYLKNGTIANNYSNVLVLLLRLRQICNHPKLIKHVEQPATDSNTNFEEDQIGFAKSIQQEVVKRLLDAEVVGDCSICMDSANDAVIVHNCGHIYCRECLTEHANHPGPDDRACPECRGPLDFSKLVPLKIFNHVYRPEPVIDLMQTHTLSETDNLSETPSDEDNLEEWISSSKTEKIVEVLETIKEKKEKTVLFSQFTGFLELLQKPLNDAGIKFLPYTGSMDINQRVETVEKFFHDEEVAVMLVSMKCGSLGLNLTCANHVILADPWWNPALDNQAIDRVHRIGQTRDVEVHRILVPNTVEDRIMALQENKQKVIDEALGEGNSTKIGKLGINDLIFLFTGNSNE